MLFVIINRASRHNDDGENNIDGWWVDRMRSRRALKKRNQHQLKYLFVSWKFIGH